MPAQPNENRTAIAILVKRDEPFNAKTAVGALSIGCDSIVALSYPV